MTGFKATKKAKSPSSGGFEVGGYTLKVIEVSEKKSEKSNYIGLKIKAERDNEEKSSIEIYENLFHESEKDYPQERISALLVAFGFHKDGIADINDFKELLNKTAKGILWKVEEFSLKRQTITDFLGIHSFYDMQYRDIDSIVENNTGDDSTSEYKKNLLYVQENPVKKLKQAKLPTGDDAPEIPDDDAPF